MIDIVTTIRHGSLASRALSLPLSAIAQKILGKDFELSVVLCGDALATRINTEYRQKTYRPNVLSFPLSRSQGEIFLNLRIADREARTYKLRFEDRVAYLFIHGCLHVKGFDHGKEMERLERRFVHQFNIDHPPGA